jgi:2-polyprenyl-6-methoxyphenol hydroxylase-like FAD-dependent oxidoreductase
MSATGATPAAPTADTTDTTADTATGSASRSASSTSLVLPRTDHPSRELALRPPTSRSLAPKTLRVAVIGGSLTGPAIALLLLHAGLDVTVYEAVPASAPQGGGLIGLDHSSLDILDRLGIPQSQFTASDSETVVHLTVQQRRATETSSHIYPGRNTTWPQLHTALTRQLPAGILHTGKRVTSLTERYGQPVIGFADGDTAPADLVVFADGRSSIGRRILDRERQLHYAGYVAHRGQINGPITAAGARTAEPELRDFLRIEPSPNVGVQFNIAPIPAGADWTFYLNATPARYAELFGAPPARRLFALPQYVSAAARAEVDAAARRYLPDEHAALVHATGTRMAVPVMDIDPPTRMVWSIGRGHAVLLGDALAPVRPHTARGANNGIEQAWGLTAALTQHHRWQADLPAALDGWQHRHLPAAVAAVQLGPVLGRRFGHPPTHQPTQEPGQEPGQERSGQAGRTTA